MKLELRDQHGNPITVTTASDNHELDTTAKPPNIFRWMWLVVMVAVLIYTLNR